MRTTALAGVLAREPMLVLVYRVEEFMQGLPLRVRAVILADTVTHPLGVHFTNVQELCIVPKRTCDPAGRLSTGPPERLGETQLRRAGPEETAALIQKSS